MFSEQEIDREAKRLYESSIRPRLLYSGKWDASWCVKWDEVDPGIKKHFREKAVTMLTRRLQWSTPK